MFANLIKFYINNNPEILDKNDNLFWRVCIEYGRANIKSINDQSNYGGRANIKSINDQSNYGQNASNYEPTAEQHVEIINIESVVVLSHSFNNERLD